MHEFDGLNPANKGLLQVMGNPRLWGEALLITPTTGKPFKANYVQTQILESKRRFNVIRVHRRAGKSFAFTILALYYALTVDSCEILIIGPAGNHVERIFATIRDFIRVNEWIQPHKVGDKQSPHRLEFDNGSVILGLTTGARAKSGGTGIRGQGADVILVDEGAYLDDGDWPSILPIMKGDENRRFPPRAYIASTPAHTRGYYYEFCKNPRMKKAWNEVHVSIEDNPTLSKEFVEEARGLCPSELDWIREYLAEFPEIGEGVFPRSMVEGACRDYQYATALKAAGQAQLGDRPPSRTMGVDWDKYNKDGHGPNLVILEALPDGRYRVIYREEIPQSKFSLSHAVERIIELDRLFQPEWIYVDRGYGEHQIEELQRRGLDKKVVGHTFADVVEFPLPGGGVDKRRFKQAMISILRGWFERGVIELPTDDRAFQQQFLDYHVVAKTDQTIKYSSENEHGIDALGLAAMAMFLKVKRPYQRPPATRSHRLDVPQAIPKAQLYDQRPAGQVQPGRIWYDTETAPTTFARSGLGRTVPGSRSTF
jgi:replicative DNA helicase